MQYLKGQICNGYNFFLTKSTRGHYKLDGVRSNVNENFMIQINMCGIHHDYGSVFNDITVKRYAIHLTYGGMNSS